MLKWVNWHKRSI